MDGSVQLAWDITVVLVSTLTDSRGREEDWWPNWPLQGYARNPQRFIPTAYTFRQTATATVRAQSMSRSTNSTLKILSPALMTSVVTTEKAPLYSSRCQSPASVSMWLFFRQTFTCTTIRTSSHFTSVFIYFFCFNPCRSTTYYVLVYYRPLIIITVFHPWFAKLRMRPYKMSRCAEHV